ncbi:putative UHRF1-binding protein [Helianthus anomalus]
MESIMSRALEYTLKYWFKSFTRDQFKLQGRTVQLSNLVVSYYEAKCIEIEEFYAISL